MLLEELGVLYRGLVLGLVIAAPVGPVGLLCIRRTLQKGMIVGLATGLGAAYADAIFGGVAVLGVSAVMEFIERYEATIRLTGGALVLFTAWHTWHDHPQQKPPTLPNEQEKNVQTTWKGTGRALFSGLLITLTNPLTLFGTLAVVATFGGITRKLEANVLVAGIFLGSALWWLLLSGGVGLIRRHFTESRIIALNRITAVCLTALAGWAIYSGVQGYLH